MATAASPAPRFGRLATWFGHGNDDPASTTSRDPVSPGDSRALVERRLYAEIGEFLSTHGLAPTPLHFEIAHAYLAGSDPAIARAVGTMIAQAGRLDAATVARLIEDIRPANSGPRALSSLADQLEERLAECLNAADRSHHSARSYGEALDIAQSRLEQDPHGTLTHIAGLTREVVTTTRLVESELLQTRLETERLRSDLDRAREAAEHDHLTGLPNRRGLERRIETLIAARKPGDPAPRVTIALCDIDDFKLVNDIHGHQAGDRVLKFVGGFLASELGDTACVARHGGEEFAVVIQGSTPHEAMMLLDEVRERLSARSLINQETGVPIGRITFSAGIAALDDDGARALNDADIALYAAKRGGKNAIMLAPANRR